jgi:integrase
MNMFGKNKLKSGPGKWVFQNKIGSFVDMNNFRKRVFEPLCEAAELHKTRLHDSRHSYAAAVIVGTKDMYYAQRQLGHASITTTVNTYGHWLEEDENIRPVDMLDEAAG